jgi:hypothetical protein
MRDYNGTDHSKCQVQQLIDSWRRFDPAIVLKRQRASLQMGISLRVRAYTRTSPPAVHRQRVCSEVIRMRRLVMLFSVVVLIGTGLAYAQADDTWPPRPEGLFAPGIEVVKADPVPDDEAQVLYLYEADGWHAYPYPTDFTIAGVRDDYYGNAIGPRVYRRPDGRWLVLGEDAKRGYRHNFWLLDPNSGAFTLADPPCGQVAPDGSWAVCMAFDDSQGYPGQYHFYSCNLYTGEVFSLGTVRPELVERDVAIDGWLDDTHFVVTVTAMPEWSGRLVYVGDASQPDSIDFAALMLRFWPRVITDPPSVEAMYAVMEDGPSAGPCFLEHYDALTREHILYDTGDLCAFGWGNEIVGHAGYSTPLRWLFSTP